MTLGADLDHTAFAVDDALAWARTLRRELGAAPLTGEQLTEFRYLQLRVGDEPAGACIELLDAAGPGFLRRFLDRRGAGPHHLTFTVPDLRAAVGAARDAGLTVVGEDYAHPSWCEAFLAPDTVHGVVVQLAQTDGSFGSDTPWWAPVWEETPLRAARLGATRLGSTDLAASRRLFGDLLGADVRDVSDGLECRWPGGVVRVDPSELPGVTGMDLTDGPPDGIAIGPSRLAAP